MSKLQGISVRLPLAYSQEDGPYALNKTLGPVIKQNFKNMLLTSPGERPMIPEFGCGLRRVLFEGISGRLQNQVVTLINKQVTKYLPFINIEKISFITSDQDSHMDLNAIRISIEYNVGSIDTSDRIEISPIND